MCYKILKVITGKNIILYSSGIATILASLLAWLIVFSEKPNNADMRELQGIVNDLKDYNMNNNTNQNIGETPKVPVVRSELSTTMAWMYPGDPACDAIKDAKKHKFDVLKVEYFLVTDTGDLELMTEKKYGCNGYTKDNASIVSTLAGRQFVVVSSSYALDMDKFLLQDIETGEHTDKLVQFVLDNKFTGVEIDFEDFGGWSEETTLRYIGFIKKLGDKLHSVNKQLMIDLPPASNKVEEQWNKFSLSDFNDLPIDYIVIMGYDYQYDHGVGQPVSPLKWLSEVTLFTRSQIKDHSKIVIGVSSYGYVGNLGTKKMEIMTQEQLSMEPLYKYAERDESSGEMIAKKDGKVLVYQDSESVSRKIDTVLDSGIGKVSIWHIGGNSLPVNN